MNKKFIFILGCYNSGTSLLNHLIKQHRDIGGFPGNSEGADFTLQFHKPEQFGFPRMWYKCNRILTKKDKLQPPNIDILIDDWLKILDPKKNIYVEKSVINARYINFLHKNFKSSLFIWILRNPYFVSNSIKKKVKFYRKYHFLKFKINYPIEFCIKQWLLSNNTIMKNIENKDYLKIYYEDLVKNPKKIINKVCSKLKIETNVNIPKYFMFNHKKKIIRNRDNFSELDVNDVKNINRILTKQKNIFGYKINC